MKKKLLLSFIIPIAILLIVFLILGINPFGNRTIVVIDSNTQYISFISYLRSIFLGTNDLKYTFSASLGENFIPLLGYYLMSPLNLITLLFKEQNMQLALTIIMLIKIGLCGLSMEYFLQTKYKDKNTLIFSICYALMAYNMVYIYHLMWLDSIALFPLVILGINNIFENKKPLLYIITLSLSIILNYYIGIIICLGSLIYFIYKFLLDYKKINKIKIIINYAISSFLSGLTAMFIIVPTLLALSKSKASFSLSNLNFSSTTSYLRVIAKSFTASVGIGETWHGGPMIASGMIIIILIILYFLNKKIKKREKIINGALLLFMITTFVIQALDLLFHGLNVPNCFDYRHAFLYVFFAISLASESYFNLKIEKKDIKITAIIMVLLSILIFLFKYKFNTSTYNVTIIIALIISLWILYTFYKDKNLYKMLLIITLIDLFINTIACILTIMLSDVQLTNKYKDYINDVKNVIVELKDYDNSFYRMEKTFDRASNDNMLAINDSMIFDYYGISHFDSTSRSDVEAFLESFGFRRLLTRSYYNKNGSVTAADMLFGIKYVLSYDKYKNYKNIITNEDLSIFKNPYALSLGYAIRDDYTIESNNPFENINSILKSFTSTDKNVYVPATYKIETSNTELNGDTYISDEGAITYTIKITDEDELYFYFSNNGSIENSYDIAKMYVNGEYIDDYFTKYNRGVTSLGKYNIGDTVVLEFKFNDELTINDTYFYYENIDILEEQYKILSKNQVEITKVTSSHLKGRVNLDKDSKILFTIPYDEGWKITVDGKEVEIDECLGTLISIDVSKGPHDIDLSFTPDGLKKGIIISITSLAGIVLYMFIYRKMQK